MRRPLVGYCVLATVIWAWAAFEFGASIVLAVLLLVPVYALARTQWSPNLRTRGAGILVTALVVLGAYPALISAWYEHGLHHEHAFEVAAAELEDVVGSDPRFVRVVFGASREVKTGWVVTLHGRVETQADYDALLKLAKDIHPPLASALNVERLRVADKGDRFYR